MATSRANVSCAMRFSEPPASPEARTALCKLTRQFLPMHPDEGLVPLRVWRLQESDHAWLADRSGPFENYRRNRDESRLRMSKVFNVACSALAAISSLEDDRLSHRLTASATRPYHYPARLNFVLQNMASEAGWVPQRPVALHILGSTTICRAKVASVEVIPDQRALSVTIEAFIWSHRSINDALHRYGRYTGALTFVIIDVRLGRQTNRADPIYEAIAHMQTLTDLSHTSLASRIADLVYGGPQDAPMEQAEAGDPIVVAPSFQIRGTTMVLTNDQVAAVRLAVSNEPIVAIQAAFGTGKTMVGAIIAALIASRQPSIVVVTATTNAAVAQFTETLLSLDDFAHLEVLRYLSDTAASENLYPTEVDLNVVLKSLGDRYGAQLDDAEKQFCRVFKEKRELLEQYMEDPSKFLYMSEEDQHEYEIAERSVSQSIEKMVKLMFRVRRPAILCLTTASLLNTTDPSNGLFRRHSSTFGTIIGDEASQIPEPALAAIASRIPEAKQRYIGDIHQLEPHARCQRNSNPAIFGARSVMSVLVGAAAVPVSPLVTTFRAHPALNALPNLVAYDGTLLNGTGPESRQLLLSAMHFPTPEVPFMFLNIAGKSTKAASKSHFNTDEANACVRLIELLLGKGIQPNQICVISFYKEQSRHLQSRLDRLGVELTTVDSVQGREKEVVILLTTRTNFSADSADFLDDYRRVNVATTRCRHGQFILGNAESLTKVPFWRRILDWAASLNAIVPAYTFDWDM
uniref:AAA_12 domain-containing protein n=1 Tax=Haemonchus contortus TaxID=6289 RepID=A0A7I4XWS9_HAECO